MFVRWITLFLLLVVSSFSSIYQCPDGDQCLGCDYSKRSYVCVTIPPGYHYPSASDEIDLFEDGYKGFSEGNTLEYRVIFHNNTLDYPCDTWCSNINKLFGITRGLVPVMDQSCIFGWRKPLKQDPQGVIGLWAYGWKNDSLPPWETPGQMPFMIWLDIQKEYILTIQKQELECIYSVVDGDTGKTLSQATTPQESPSIGPSYYFSLYFGGEETTTTPVTVSYSSQIDL